MPVAPPSAMSPSSVGTFSTCPKQFFYSRIMRYPDPGSDASVMGNFVHDILEHLLGLNSEARTQDSAKTLARTLWDEKYDDDTAALGLSKDEQHALRWNAWNCVTTYFEMEDPADLDVDEDHLERKVSGEIDGVPVRGIVDRWTWEPDDSLIVSDYKTGKVPKPRYEGEKRFQIMVYVHLLEEELGAEAKYGELLYVKAGVRKQYDPDKRSRTNMKKKLVTTWEKVQLACEAEDFPTKPSVLCDWCAYKSFCPAFGGSGVPDGPF